MYTYCLRQRTLVITATKDLFKNKSPRLFSNTQQQLKYVYLLFLGLINAANLFGGCNSAHIENASEFSDYNFFLFNLLFS